MSYLSSSYRWLLVWCLLLGAAGAHAKEIQLQLDSHLPDPRSGAPVTFGVPFPRGELSLNALDTVRLVQNDGQVVPHQQRVNATWNPNGSEGVRWLLIDAQVDARQAYRLVYGQGVPAAAPAAKDIARETEERVIIDAGFITGFIRKNSFEPFTTLMSLGQPIAIKPEDAGTYGTMPEPMKNYPNPEVLAQRVAAMTPPAPFNGLYVEHAKRGLFRSDLDQEAQVTIEENGPLRCIIKAEGWYTNEAGEKFCRYLVRLHIFRNRTDLKLDHTFIFTGLSREDPIRSLGVRILRAPVEAGKATRLYAGNADGLEAGVGGMDGTGRMCIVQDQSERGRFDFYQANDLGGVVKQANQGGGWLTGIHNQGFEVAIRDAWQQFPWALRFFEGLLDIELWPPHAGLLETTWDGYWNQLTERQKRWNAANMQTKEPDIDKWLALLRDKTNGTGVAKTHEVWLSFMGPQYGAARGIYPATGQLAREVAYPVLMCADPQWMCATQALDWQPHMARNRTDYSQEEACFDAMLYFMQSAVAANNWYGWWNWGGYHQHLFIGPQVPRAALWADDAAEQAWHRAHPKSHYQWGRFPWVEYFRSGDRNWLRYAQTYTLYSADRAHAHHTGNGRNNGGEYHYDNSHVHWVGGYRFSPGGDQLSSNLQGKDDYVYQYWMTGDRHALDVLIANGNLIVEHHAKGGTQFRWKPGFERGNDIRNAGMQLERLMSLYQATWDERYLNVAKDVANAFKPLVTTEQVRAAENNNGGVFHQALTWAYQGMWLYWSVTQDAEFRPALQAFIDRNRDYVAGMPGTGSGRALAYGYLLTGDTTYLDFARAQLDAFVAQGITNVSFAPSYKQELNPLPGLLGVLNSAPKEWRYRNLPPDLRGGTLSYRYHAYGLTNPHMQPARAFLNETADQAFSFILATSKGGGFTLYDPQGKAVATQTMDPATQHWCKFEVPADGVTGTYTLVCTESNDALKQTGNFLESPTWARVLDCPLPVVVEFGKRPLMLTAVARTLYFQVPATGETPAVYLSELDPARRLRVFNPNGQWSVSTLDRPRAYGGGAYFVIPEEQRGQLLGLQVVQEPNQIYKWGASWPQFIILENMPNYVSANAEDFFIPQIPDSLQSAGKP